MKASEYIARLQELMEVAGGDPEVIVERPRVEGEPDYVSAFPELQNCNATQGGYNYFHGHCDSQCIVVD